MNKVEAKPGREAIYKGQIVTITRTWMVEKSCAPNITFATVVDAAGNTYEVNARSLRVVSPT